MKTAPLISRLSATLLAALCLLGAIHSAVVLSRPETGLLQDFPRSHGGPIGVPRTEEDGSERLADGLEVLESAGTTSGDNSVWILQSDELASDTWSYLQMQLSSIAYPRTFYLLPGDSIARIPENAERLLCFTECRPGSPWRRHAVAGGATIYWRSR